MNISKISDYVYLTYPIRRGLLILLLALGIVPLKLVFMLPISMRVTYTYLIGFTAIAALSFTLGKFSSIAVNTIWEVIFNKKTVNIETKEPSWLEAAGMMKINKPVRFFISRNAKLQSAFTNPIKRKIYFPEEWLKFSRKEQLSVIGHELDHIKNFKIFVTWLIVILIIAIGLSLALDYVTAPIFVSLSIVSFELLLIGNIVRKNELHADLMSGIEFGPEGLISVFEIMKEGGNDDLGSETHPAITKRISLLYDLMEKIEGPEK